VLASVLAALHDPAFAGLFGYDEMACTAMLMRPLTDEANFRPRPLTDEDVGAVQTRLQRLALKRLSKDVTHQAASMLARGNSYHPVRDYLAAVRWDGVERLPLFFPAYFGTPDTPYEREIGRMFLVGMVARVAQPGCKVDHVPVIEGPQGTLKSTACSILGGEWFSDELPDITTKDASVHLRGKRLIEVSEMHAYNRAETTRLKSFVTRQVERYRPPYGRLEVIEPRQVCFVGTTNASAYLKDASGNRRFWPVRAGAIDTAQLQLDRDQLFAEAVARHKRAERWWPDKDFERERILPEQDARYESGDVWEDTVREYVSSRAKVTVGEVARDALGIETPRIGTADQRRIAAALEAIGWTRQPQAPDGKRWWTKA
jgi:predicted P-loop ATPase